MSRILWSTMLPLQLVEAEPVELPQYQFRHMDDYFLQNRLNRWQQLPFGTFKQPWQNSDVISLQFINNMGGIIVQIVDCWGAVKATVAATQKQQNPKEPSFFIYECNMALTGIPAGTYWVYVRVGSSPVKKYLYSEPIEIAEAHPGSLLFEFSNHEYKQNMIFEKGFSSSIRLPGIFRKKVKGRKDTTYEDQVLDMVMVKSQTFRVWELVLINVPDWVEDKLSDILGCSELRIDGRYYTLNEGAKLDKGDEKGNDTLATYRVELRETINRGAKILDTDLDPTEELTMFINTTSKGFADTSEEASSTVITFVDVE